jgi:hypothetical protein
MVNLGSQSVINNNYKIGHERLGLISKQKIHSIQQNGISERMNRTITERTMVIAADVNKAL